MCVCVCVCVCALSRFSHVGLFATLWTVPGCSAHGILQARILEWVAISFSRDIPDPGIEPASRVSSALADRLFTTSGSWEVPTANISPIKCNYYLDFYWRRSVSVLTDSYDLFPSASGFFYSTLCCEIHLHRCVVTSGTFSLL